MMSTINITPFTDVLLVLLIIFIILASVTKEPKLPDAYNKDKVTASQILVPDRRQEQHLDRLESGQYLRRQSRVRAGSRSNRSQV